MRSTTIFRRGDVIVVEVPFTDASGAKRRPGLVLSAETFHRTLPDLILCPISSQPRYYQRPGPGDYPLRHWKAVGLHYPSAVRLSNIVAVEKERIQRRLASLAGDDLEAVLGLLQRAFGL